ncbi:MULTISPECIES: hypothetical protein [unclassified Moraxella]|uniref:hypothetical protein n=1 Tax=unclassified Moraxella TaxID=2685852 RepID=UPI003AF63493
MEFDNFGLLLAYMALTVAMMGYQTNAYQQKPTMTIQQFDQFLSLSRDQKTNQLYFQSLNGESKVQCGKYWYSDYASFTHNDIQTLKNLNDVIDIASLKLDSIEKNEYTLHDKNHQYVVILTLCDNTVSFQNFSPKKSAPTSIQ